MYFVVTDEVVDGVKAHVVYEVVLGLPTLRLGMDATMVVLGVAPEIKRGVTIRPHPPQKGVILTRRKGSSLL
jgi:hypothetical protein